ncbi:MAG: tRNA uridine-5-carboxymethylaminomethyl(34) synthesis GTPase MnmE [Alphaproteobacteria bacterium]|nr:tRNA uridine-5-carboxymethylaminomethyl(34) synthesis GTPase MnmE [Alphaproteobacteria bacterium]
MDTIFALASGSQRAGVAVIRVSGPTALQTYKNLSGKPAPVPRQAVVSDFCEPGTQKMLDRGLVIYFQGPASFTGEDVVEYHVHGGVAVIHGFLSVLAKQPGCRLAEPGEFTRRAFENGKLDLTAAEAVADLIDAETEAQRMQALDQLGGGLARLYQGWAENLKKTLAHQEAEIEFPDEDMPVGIAQNLKPEIQALVKEIREHLDDKRRGERLRNGVLIAILGAPNAGKSSLLNALARREAAIVSEEAGTTRDIIEVHLDLGGYPVILADTAGLRTAESKIEAEGIRRAQKLASDADIKIVLFDSTSAAPDAATLKMVDENTLVALTKADLSPPRFPEKEGWLHISSTTGAGLDVFLEALTKKAAGLFASRSGPSLTRERHRLALQETVTALERCLGTVLPELAAEDLRLALRSLGSITGKVQVEDLLDTIFRDFCIGK